TLLAYLGEKHGIKLTTSHDDGLSEFLSKARGSTYFVLTKEHRHAYLDKLNTNTFNEDELRDYNNAFTDSDDDEAGQPMLAGISALCQALGHVDERSIVLLSIG